MIPIMQDEFAAMIVGFLRQQAGDDKLVSIIDESDRAGHPLIIVNMTARRTTKHVIRIETTHNPPL
jgi:hypothetical protein